MSDAPYGLALAAGLLAAVNPCGFALLPAYLSMLVLGGRDGGPSGDPGGHGGDRRGRPAADRSRFVPVSRALALTGAMTVGFVAVFGAFGLLAAPAADALARRLPVVSVLIGLALVALGGWLLAGRQLPTLTPRIATGPAVTLRFAPMALFGAAYAIASLGCTIGPFLAVVVAAFRAGSLARGVGLFIAYALGMALVVGAAALAVAVAREELVRRIRRAAPAISRLGGALLVLAGGYVAWYGWYELRVFAGATTGDPVVDGAATVQSAVSQWLADLGPGVIAGTAGLLLAAAIGIAVVRRRT
jgi:cytochrome c biogenesis protein CcdA